MNRKAFVRHLILLILLPLLSCDEAPDKNGALVFVGDSIIEQWDLQSSFSSMITYNRGKSGAGIGYIESLGGSMSGQNVVVMVGTNDNYRMVSHTREAYGSRYVEAIRSLGASKVYLFEVLPRCYGNDREYINRDIAEFNALVAKTILPSDNIVVVHSYSEFSDNYNGILEEYYCDGLHLNAVGYEVLRRLVIKEL